MIEKFSKSTFFFFFDKEFKKIENENKHGLNEPTHELMNDYKIQSKSLTNPSFLFSRLIIFMNPTRRI